MKTKKLKIFAFVFWGAFTCLCRPFCALGKETEIGKISAIRLEQIFKNNNYTNYLQKPDYAYPQIFVQTMPEGFSEIKSRLQRQKLFMMILIPLTLRLNAELEEERGAIEYITYKFNQNLLDDSDIKIIEDLARRYDIFTRMQGERRYAVLLKHLQRKIDIIPPSILIAAAAIGTNWGDAYFLPPTNSLYRELVWYTDDGFKPWEETEDDSYRIKIYPSLYDSMKDYALKLNSSPDFEEFRYFRNRLRQRGGVISGKFMAPYLLLGAQFPNYAGLIDYTITFYRLSDLDAKAKFRESPPANTPAENVTKN